ncbi:CCT domain [Dillenia turbinata]|uniref:CCT domain n=1 Tax=Dillenia turbinata TaxID=194707 RepID=A0AAN8VX92_9MAGN
MSSCLSGGGRTYGFDLEIVKSPSTSSRTLHSSSPSSTLSESSNSPIAISTTKPRTARKRPNQTYNEAAALLSTAYPNLFSSKHLSNPSKFHKPIDPFWDDSSELLLPFHGFDHSGFLLGRPQKPSFQFESKILNLGGKPCQSQGNSMDLCDAAYEEDFDAESILDEEMEEGIDSIMGNLSVNNESNSINEANSCNYMNFCNWNPLGLEFGFGIRRGIQALRQTDQSDCWRFPTVDIAQVSPKLTKVPAEKKKKKKIADLKDVELPEIPKENPNPNSDPKPPNSGLLLKLNYEEVFKAWSNKGSPFSEDSEVPGNDAPASVRLAQIDLFGENGGVREASVLRYKEKRRTRLFSKKIRYQVRKVNADRRPRMKGRFVRRPNSNGSGQRGKET